jgi:hypothetical protein
MIYNDILYRKEPFLVSKKTPIPLSRLDYELGGSKAVK